MGDHEKDHYVSLQTTYKALCCSFRHRMNCANSAGEILVTREKLEKSRTRGEGLLSEFYF